MDWTGPMVEAMSAAKPILFMSQRLGHNERVDMDSLRGKTVLVLGGSGALGALITSGLIANGAQVMATTTANEKGDLIPSAASPRLLLDLERPESIEVLVNYLIQSNAQIDGIVNATGVVAFGAATELSASTLAKLAAVNFTGPICRSREQTVCRQHQRSRRRIANGWAGCLLCHQGGFVGI
jgi:NAD(P)-dependent dehydrogenase (short-subunit alcohol dehydrogenase family)